MSKPRLFLCGGATIPNSDKRRDGHHVKDLSTFGKDANVNFRVEDLCKAFGTTLNDRLADLLDIAAYVYAGDCNTKRGTSGVDCYGQKTWSRDLRFVIPVKDLAFWNEPKIKTALTGLLSKLSNDCFEFDFVTGASAERQQVFEFSENDDWPFRKPDRVLLFSGGLDSLAGAVETAQKGENLVLVSHRTTATIEKRQRDLREKLQAAYPAVKVLHIPVCLHLTKNHRSSEPTQRTRSFLFASLAAVVARSTEAGGIRFFENGVVSINLPVADEVLGARASRTTHPRTLADFQDFFSLVIGGPLAVDNPFIWKTKTDIVEKVAKSNDPTLIGLSRSCAHTIFTSKLRWHCGQCSQCIDRRIAVYAAKAERFDAEDDYEVSVFTGPRKEGYDQNIAINYVRQAKELAELGADRIVERYSDEIIEANRFLGGNRHSAQQICDLLERHGQTVSDVISSQICANAKQLFEGYLSQSSLIRLVVGNQHQHQEWERFSNAIVECLQRGLPPMCKSGRPKTEPDLQCWCDGLLKSGDLKLQREFPFARWGIVGTKPDWSEEEINLWVELKYARKNSASPGRISEDIAADITKYGDAGKRVLFVTFDPDRLIPDDEDFMAPIIEHNGMRAAVIR